MADFRIYVKLNSVRRSVKLTAAGDPAISADSGFRNRRKLLLNNSLCVGWDNPISVLCCMSCKYSVSICVTNSLDHLRCQTRRPYPPRMTGTLTSSAMNWLGVRMRWISAAAGQVNNCGFALTTEFINGSCQSPAAGKAGIRWKSSRVIYD